MKKRSHRNSKRRLTARERAIAVIKDAYGDIASYHMSTVPFIQRAIQAAVRQALKRKERRAK